MAAGPKPHAQQRCEWCHCGFPRGAGLWWCEWNPSLNRNGGQPAVDRNRRQSSDYWNCRESSVNRNGWESSINWDCGQSPLDRNRWQSAIGREHRSWRYASIRRVQYI